MKQILEVKNLNKVFRRFSLLRKVNYIALNNVSFVVKENEIFAITGLNSSGKTILTNIIAGYVKQDSGDIIFSQNTCLTHGDYKSRRNLIRLVNNDLEELIDNNLNICEILNDILLMVGSNNENDNYVKIQQILTLLKFPAHQQYVAINLLDTKCKILSSFAYALIMQPKILLIDDLLSHFDVMLQSYIINVILLLKKYGYTIMLTTNHIGVIKHICDSLLILNSGIVEEFGNCKELLLNSKNIYTRRLVDSYFNEKLDIGLYK